MTPSTPHTGSARKQLTGQDTGGDTVVEHTSPSSSVTKYEEDNRIGLKWDRAVGSKQRPIVVMMMMRRGKKNVEENMGEIQARRGGLSLSLSNRWPSFLP